MCTYSKAKGDAKEDLKEEHNSHSLRKGLCREAKMADLLAARENEGVCTVLFDLESILQLPSGDVNQLYYMRKLNRFNLTIYNLETKEAWCYLWNETEGCRGSLEIVTCIFLFPKSLPETCTDVRLWSDGCWGQNRNQFIAAMYMYVVDSMCIRMITHNYLEMSHMQMEWDSMHAAIEQSKKHDCVAQHDARIALCVRAG